MNALKLFLSAFWPPFIAGGVILSLVWLAKRAAADGYPPFIGPKSFPELSSCDQAEQKRLLHEASNEAFRGWRLFIPICLFNSNFASGVALGYMLPLLTPFPNSLWVWTGIGALAAIVAAWAAGRLERRLVRQRLKQSATSVEAK